MMNCYRPESNQEAGSVQRQQALAREAVRGESQSEQMRLIERNQPCCQLEEAAVMGLCNGMIETDRDYQFGCEHGLQNQHSLGLELIQFYEQTEPADETSERDRFAALCAETANSGGGGGGSSNSSSNSTSPSSQTLSANEAQTRISSLGKRDEENGDKTIAGALTKSRLHLHGLHMVGARSLADNLPGAQHQPLGGHHQRELYSNGWTEEIEHKQTSQQQQQQFNLMLGEQNHYSPQQHDNGGLSFEKACAPPAGSIGYRRPPIADSASLCAINQTMNDFNNNSDNHEHDNLHLNQCENQQVGSVSFTPLMPIGAHDQLDQSQLTTCKPCESGASNEINFYQHQYHYEQLDSTSNALAIGSSSSAALDNSSSAAAYNNRQPHDQHHERSPPQRQQQRQQQQQQHHHHHNNQHHHSAQQKDEQHQEQGETSSSNSVKNVPNGQYQMTDSNSPPPLQQQAPYEVGANYGSNVMTTGEFQDYYQANATNYSDQCESLQQQRHHQQMSLDCYSNLTSESRHELAPLDTGDEQQRHFEGHFVQSHLTTSIGGTQQVQLQQPVAPPPPPPPPTSLHQNQSQTSHANHQMQPTNDQDHCQQQHSYLAYNYHASQEYQQHLHNETYSQVQQQHQQQQHEHQQQVALSAATGASSGHQGGHFVGQLVRQPASGGPNSQPADRTSLMAKSNGQTKTGFRTRSLRGRPRKKKSNTRGKVSGKLWEFIRDLLLSECTNPSFIRWERREDGVFKFVQSDKVAKMWGERKQNPKMTYEKLSRAMRYYYKSKVLLPVFGRRLVYKFGPNATGWMSASQQQLFDESQQRQLQHQHQNQNQANLASSQPNMANNQRAREFYQ